MLEPSYIRWERENDAFRRSREEVVPVRAPNPTQRGQHADKGDQAYEHYLALMRRMSAYELVQALDDPYLLPSGAEDAPWDRAAERVLVDCKSQLEHMRVLRLRQAQQWRDQVWEERNRSRALMERRPISKEDFLEEFAEAHGTEDPNQRAFPEWQGLRNRS